MIHVAGKVDPVDDIDVINFELALSDITQVTMRLPHAAGLCCTGKRDTKGDIMQHPD